MAQVVTVMNMKGGVGKTTVSMHIAASAARHAFKKGSSPLKVLAIDYDPQFNLSQSLLKFKDYAEMEKSRATVLSVLVEDTSDPDPYELQVPGNSIPPSVDNVSRRVFGFGKGYLDLVPSTLNLMYLALSHTTKSIEPIEERFRRFIDECRSKYDLIVIDCHPAGSIFTKTSLRNSDHVVIPVVPQKYAVRGVGLMMEFIEGKKQGLKSATPHILFNNVSRTIVSKQELEIRANPKFANYCMKATLKKFSAFGEPQEGKGFCWQSSKAYSTLAFTNMNEVTSEFLTRVNLQ